MRNFTDCFNGLVFEREKKWPEHQRFQGLHWFSNDIVYPSELVYSDEFSNFCPGKVALRTILASLDYRGFSNIFHGRATRLLDHRASNHAYIHSEILLKHLFYLDRRWYSYEFLLGMELSITNAKLYDWAHTKHGHLWAARTGRSGRNFKWTQAYLVLKARTWQGLLCHLFLHVHLILQE